MILRKPYAFLIKHFKLIHLILCIPLIYIIIKTGAIASFFSNYVSSSYYTSLTNIAGTYINYFMYLAILVIILLSLTIFFLMRQKKKDTHFYLFLIGYYILLFVLLSICHSMLNSIETGDASAQLVRSYRDISYIVYIPQFFFLIYMGLRGIGFDIKKFNFDEDARELEIDDFDNEEFELVLGKDSYKYKRQFRRLIREFKYYILENKITFAILTTVVVVICGTLLYLNFGVYNKKYHQTQKISHNGLVVTVTDSVLSNMDLGGNIISEGKVYLAIAVKIQNSSSSETTLDDDNFKVEVAGRTITATLDKSSYFVDLGLAYSRGTTIPANSENTYVLTYEIDESLKDETMTLKILDSIEIEIGSVTGTYKTVTLDYDKVFETTEIKTVDFNKILELSDTRLGMVQVKLNEVKMARTYTYTYESCQHLVCQEVTNKLVANSDKTLLLINRDFSMDTYSNYYLSRKGSSSFVSDFLKIRYTLNGTTKTVGVTDNSTSSLEEYWVLEVPREIENASNIELIINIRGSIYIMKMDVS